MPAKAAVASAQAFDATVRAAESEGRRLTKAERLQNPTLQKDLAGEKAQAIRSAERAVEKAEAQLEAAQLALAMAKKENG